MGRFEGRTAFVTGAGRGMGRAHAVALAREGANLVVSDTSRPVESVPYPTSTPEDLQETARLVRGSGARCHAVEADVALVEPEEVMAAVLFLLSDDARSITGTTMLIDAGASL